MKQLPSITDVPRNDVAAALRYYRVHKQAGSFTPEDGQMLYMLQDDDTELRAALKREQTDSTPKEPRIVVR